MMLGRVNAPINPQFLLETKFLLRKDGLRVRILQGEKTTQLEKVH
jgi:O-succinylbenzoate synthase